MQKGKRGLKIWTQDLMWANQANHSIPLKSMNVYRKYFKINMKGCKCVPFTAFIRGFFCFVYAVYADVYAVTVKFYILESLHAV